MAEPVTFATAADWRAWLDAHHTTATECLVRLVKVTAGQPNMSWSDAVDEALCVGWIDGVRRRIDDDSYSIRFTPRKPGSTWSAVNVRKVEQLRAAERMTAAGEAAYAARREDRSAVYTYEQEAIAEFGPAEQERLTADPDGWAFWQAQPPWYRRNATHWVARAKREATRVTRFEQLLTDNAAGRRLRHLSYGSKQATKGP